MSNADTINSQPRKIAEKRVARLGSSWLMLNLVVVLVGAALLPLAADVAALPRFLGCFAAGDENHDRPGESEPGTPLGWCTGRFQWVVRMQCWPDSTTLFHGWLRDRFLQGDPLV